MRKIIALAAVFLMVAGFGAAETDFTGNTVITPMGEIVVDGDDTRTTFDLSGQPDGHNAASDWYGSFWQDGVAVDVDGDGTYDRTTFDLSGQPDGQQSEATYRHGNEAPQEKKVAGQPTYDDLEMERGVKVAAANSGTVKWFDDKGGYGIIVDLGGYKEVIVTFDGDGASASVFAPLASDSLEYVQDNGRKTVK